MRTAVDVRKYRETMREQGMSSLGEARKFVRACVGATELAYERVRTELKDLPARNRVQVERLQMRAKKLSKVDVGKQVLATYEDLAERGEVVIQRLREHPQARVVFTRPMTIAKHIEEAAGRVTTDKVKHDAPETAGPAADDRKAADGRKPAPHKAPAHKGAAHR